MKDPLTRYALMKKTLQVFIFSAISLLLVTLSFTSFSQTKTVKRVTGKCEFSRHITREQAEEKALREAKTNALSEAGVPEDIWSVMGIVSDGDGQEFQEVYSQMSTLAIGGLVRLLGKPEYSEMEDPYIHKTFVVATIDAEVKTSNKVDKTYQIKIEDFAAVYKTDERIQFSIELFGHESYLKLFWFDSEGGSMLFPNQYETDRVFSPKKKYSFPLNEVVEYSAEKKDPEADMERVNLIVVATRDEYPYLSDEVSFESLLGWIYGIDSDKRAVAFHTFIIK